MENGGVSLGYADESKVFPESVGDWVIFCLVGMLFILFLAAQKVRQMAAADNIPISSLPVWKRPIGWILYLVIKFWWVIPVTIVLIFVYAFVWGMVTGLGGSL